MVSNSVCQAMVVGKVGASATAELKAEILSVRISPAKPIISLSIAGDAANCWYICDVIGAFKPSIAELKRLHICGLVPSLLMIASASSDASLSCTDAVGE